MTRHLGISFSNILRLRDPSPRVELVVPKKSKTLWKIPAEIVESIFQLLSDLDRACFALSYNMEYVWYQHCPGRCYSAAFKTNVGYTATDVKIFTVILDGKTPDGGFYNLVADVIRSPLYPNVMLGATSNTMTKLTFVHAQASHFIKSNIQSSTFELNRKL
ncbi:hypothetical protein N7475_006241 [Penicillium sp. IBT 31633x]|nr:hypothetical protein N7475_006241 [Penicillium sp. IBT 31633x]